MHIKRVGNKTTYTLLVAIVIGLILFGCVGRVERLPTQTLLASATTTEIAATPTITLTPTPIPPTRTPIPPTRTPILPTRTPIPTLPLEEQDAYLINLIETNGGCEFPCVMGIEAGKSIWEDLREIQGPIYYIENYTPNGAELFRIPFSVGIQKSFTNLELTFWGSEEIIENIKVDARRFIPNDRNYVPAFAQMMSQYSMDKMLSKLGVPSHIRLHVRGQSEPESGTQAEILLFYDEIGVIAHYLFENVVTQDMETYALKACPDYEHTYFIRLYVQSPDSKVRLERMIGDETDYFLNYFLHPLEEITDLTVEDFYTLFVESDETPCFEVP